MTETKHTHPLPVLSFAEYIVLTNDTAVYPALNTGTIAELSYIGLALMGEAGELGNKVKKIIRNGPEMIYSVTFDPENLKHIAGIKEEMGDILWYYARICQFFGWTLDEIMAENVDKLQGRKATGTLKVHE